MKPVSWNLPQLDWQAIDAVAAGHRVVVDSRQIQPGDVFMAFRGEFADGRKYISDAISAGAVAVLWEAEGFRWEDAWPVPNVAIPHLRAQAGIVASHLLGDPSQDLWVAGITGTNGKTSISSWLAQAFTALGGKGGVLGTIGNGFPGALEASTHTTLDPVGLQGWFRRLADEGATHVALEVSSHGLDQARAHGVAFDCAVFTNLTRDHLDYHETMEAYGDAKARLFEWEGLEHAVINCEDEFGRRLLAESHAKTVWSYGLNEGDIRAKRLDVSLDGIRIEVITPLGDAEIVSPMIGRFNASNLLACLGVLLASGASLDAAVKALATVSPAPGRMQRVGGGTKALVIVDYAHTRGIRCGIQISLSMIQQQAFQAITLLRPYPSYQRQVDHTLAWLFQAPWDYVSLDVTLGEHLPFLDKLLPDAQMHIEQQVEKRYGARLMYATHVF